MMAFKLLIALGSLLLLSGRASGLEAPEDLLNPVDTVFLPTTRRYIVQFSETGSLRYRKRDGGSNPTGFFSTLKDSGTTATPAVNFESTLFHGVSFDLDDTSEETVSSIHSLPEVQRIWPAATFSLPVTSNAIIQEDVLSAWNPHNDTNVARVHASGYLGSDIVIAIVDSGIDYTHPALGGGFGPGYKVEAGYDLVGDDYVLGGAYVPDSDPKDCLGHGTHVAGIIASSNPDLPGVAPSARLRAYKVFGCADSTMEDVIVNAFLQAYEEGADVINASLGSSQGFPDTPLALVVSMIQAAGVFVAVAAGNSGELGPFYSSSGGNGVDSTTVGSVQHDEFVAFAVTATSSSGESREFAYLSSDMTQFEFNGTLSGFLYEDTRKINSCNLWSSAVTPADTIIILPRGDCVWQIMDSVLIEKADWAFYYNFEGAEWELPSRQLYDADRQVKGFALISYEDGDWIVSQYEQNSTVTFNFVADQKPVAIPRSTATGGIINSFTSWGPTLDSRMKPEISAPGGGIMSTWPVAYGSYATYSGTSMASPYIAGVAALFFGSRGGRAALGDGGALLAHERIISSGNPVRHYDGSANYASVVQQGAGLVDASKVVEYGTSVSPANINLNDTVHFQGTHEIQIRNSGSEAITYQLTHEAGITIHTKAQADAWVATSPPYSTAEGDVATISLSQSEITVGPGSTETFSITITEPSAIDSSMLPVYGGAVIVAGSNGELLRVTYMGIKGDMYASDMWEMERGVPIFLSGYGGLIEEGHNYTFEDSSDVPVPYFNLLWSSREVSFDFVDRDWEPSDWFYPFVPGENKYYGSIITRPSGLTESITEFPFYNLPRFTSAFYAYPQGVFSHNGDKIPSGEYKLLARALRTFGDWNNADDWQYKVSPWFRINRQPVDNTTQTSTSSLVSATSTSSSVVSTTTTPIEPCSTTSVPISLKALVGTEERQYNFYVYSDFLAVDLSDSQTPLTFHLTEDGDIESRLPSGTNSFFSVHTNTNSLVYLYAASRITGSWSYLGCSILEGELHCESNGKEAFYICETGSGLVRHGTAPLDGCQGLTILADTETDPNCAATSTSISSLTSTFASATSTGSSQSTTLPANSTTGSYSSAPSSRTSILSASSFGNFSTTVSSSSTASILSTVPTIFVNSTTSYTTLSLSSSHSASPTQGTSTVTDSISTDIPSSSAVSMSSGSLTGSVPTATSSSTSLTRDFSSISSLTSQIVSSHASSVVSSSASVTASQTSVSPSTTTSPPSASQTPGQSSSAFSQSGFSSASGSTASSITYNVTHTVTTISVSKTYSDSNSFVFPGTETSKSTLKLSTIIEWTTSTICETRIATVTACPPSLSKCPAASLTTYVTTEIIPVSTTTCPITTTVTGLKSSKLTASASQSQLRYSSVRNPVVVSISLPLLEPSRPVSTRSEQGNHSAAPVTETEPPPSPAPTSTTTSEESLSTSLITGVSEGVTSSTLIVQPTPSTVTVNSSPQLRIQWPHILVVVLCVFLQY